MAQKENFSIGKLFVPPSKAGSGYKTGHGTFVLSSDEITMTADGSTAALTIPAGVYVLQAFAEVTTAAGEAATIDLGIANGAEFGNDLNVNRTAGLISSGPVGAGGVNAGMYFAAEDNIDATLTIAGGSGSVKFKVHALCFKA